MVKCMYIVHGKYLHLQYLKHFEKYKLLLLIISKSYFIHKKVCMHAVFKELSVACLATQYYIKLAQKQLLRQFPVRNKVQLEIRWFKKKHFEKPHFHRLWVEIKILSGNPVEKH